MAYCTKADVQAVISFTPTVTDFTPFIEAADLLVTSQCANQGVYSTANLRTIETWLAAHFLALQTPEFLSERLGDESYQTAFRMGLGLNLTRYGQMVKVLDYLGGLAYIDEHPAKGKRARPSITYLGSRRYDFGGRPNRFLGLP